MLWMYIPTNRIVQRPVYYWGTGFLSLTLSLTLALSLFPYPLTLNHKKSSLSRSVNDQFRNRFKDLCCAWWRWWKKRKEESAIATTRLPKVMPGKMDVNGRSIWPCQWYCCRWWCWWWCSWWWWWCSNAARKEVGALVYWLQHRGHVPRAQTCSRFIFVYEAGRSYTQLPIANENGSQHCTESRWIAEPMETGALQARAQSIAKLWTAYDWVRTATRAGLCGYCS